MNRVVRVFSAYSHSTLNTHTQHSHSHSPTITLPSHAHRSTYLSPPLFLHPQPCVFTFQKGAAGCISCDLREGEHSCRSFSVSIFAKKPVVNWPATDTDAVTYDRCTSESKAASVAAAKAALTSSSSSSAAAGVFVEVEAKDKSELTGKQRLLAEIRAALTAKRSRLGQEMGSSASTEKMSLKSKIKGKLATSMQLGGANGSGGGANGSS